MKKALLDFLRRGLMACGFGPLVLVILYRVLQRQGVLTVLRVDQVCLGILSVSALAFVAGGMNVLYRLERLPLMAAVLIHGIVLYAGYLVTYLINGWLDWGILPILVFTGIFVAGYFLIWLIINSVIKRNTAKINEMLKKKQQNESF